MNERILELQKQSSIEQWDYDNGCYRYILNPEKFAELIVRECSQMVEDKFDFCGDEIIIAEQILKHFGVLE